METFTGAVFIAILIVIVYVFLPFLFRYSKAFQRQLVFLPYNSKFPAFFFSLSLLCKSWWMNYADCLIVIHSTGGRHRMAACQLRTTRPFRSERGEQLVRQHGNRRPRRSLVESHKRCKMNHYDLQILACLSRLKAHFTWKFGRIVLSGCGDQ